MITELQLALLEIANTAYKTPDASVGANGELTVLSSEDKTYCSLVGLFYSLIEDGRINDLENLMKSSFPEYYNK